MKKLSQKDSLKNLLIENESLKKDKSILISQLVETNNILADLLLSQNQLEAVNKAQINFFANMSHELRNPLNAILGFTQVIQEEVFGPLENKTYKEYINFIYTGATHLLALVNDGLDLSKIQSNKMCMYEMRVNLKKVLEEIIFLAKNLYLNEKRIITLNPMPDIILKADEKMLRQIFLNILSNAVKFTKNSGHIDIFVKKTVEGIQISFQDNGIGIAKDKLPFLFQPFTQIKNDLGERYHGTGLGLVLVKKMVILHQGKIQIESEENKGTCLTIDFPRQRIISMGEKNEII